MDPQLERFLKSECDRIIRILQVTAGPGMHKLNEITPNIWISSRDKAINVDELKDYDIKTVICLSEPMPEKIIRQYRRRHIEHNQITIDDSPTQNIREVLRKTYDIILSSAVQQHKVLVHCDSGVSRASMVVIGYMLRRSYMVSFEKYKRNPKQKKKIALLRELINPTNVVLLKVIKFIKASRPCIEPNPGFVWQLLIYEQHLKKIYAEVIQEIFSQYKHTSRKKSKNHTLEDSDLGIFSDGESSSHSSDFDSKSDDDSIESAVDEILNKKQIQKSSPRKKSKKSHKKSKHQTNNSSKKSKKSHKTGKYKSDVKVNIKDSIADILAMEMSLGSDASSNSEATHEIIRATGDESSESYSNASSSESHDVSDSLSFSSFE